MKTTHRLALAAALVTVSTPVLTATEGLAGSASTGTADITVIKDAAVQISKVNDVRFDMRQMATIRQTMDSCVYSTSGTYGVEAQSLHTDGTHFRLSDGATNPSFMHYTLEWDDTVSAVKGISLKPSTTITGFGGAYTTDPTCGGGASGRLIVNIHADEVDFVATKNYVDALTLILSSN